MDDPSDPCVDSAEGDSCSHPDACVARAQCQEGACVAVERVTCADGGDICQTQVCQDGQCVARNVPDGTACDDGDRCTESDSCVQGSCQGSPVQCTAGGACRQARCDPTLGCIEQTLPDDTACDDNDRCTFGERCLAGVCTPVREQNCPRTDCQLANSCEPTTGLCVPVDVPDGTPCDDANLCTAGDRCVAGTCAPTGPADRGVPCSEGLCFTEVAEQVGVSYVPGPNVYDHGAAVAAADFDGDGDVDLFLAQELTQPALYLNRGDGTFDDATDAAGFPEFNLLRGPFQGLAAADYDNDGDVDVATFHETENRLYRNRGDATFDEVAEQAGISRLRWSVNGAFADLDLDGDLDLVVGNYILPPSAYPNHSPERNAVYRNDGDGTFTELEGGAGMHEAPAGTTLTVVSTDFDRDGRLDIIECNDFGLTVTPNRWFRNRTSPGGPIRFQEVASLLGTDVRIFCMNTALGDFDGDLDFDVYHTNIGRHALLERRGDMYVDVAVETGTDITQESCEPQVFSAGWAAGFRDFDSDGWLDLYAASGYVQSAPDLRNSRTAENKVFRNLGAPPWFQDVSATAGVTTGRRSRGVAFADLDTDGDEDVVVANMEGPFEIYRNESPQGGWARFTFEGTVSNRAGYHARFEVTDSLGRVHLRESTPHATYQSTPSSSVHVGLGAAQAVAEVQVRWPSGIEQHRFDLEAGRSHHLVEPSFRVHGARAETVDGTSEIRAEATVELLQVRDALRVRLRGASGPGADRVFSRSALQTQAESGPLEVQLSGFPLLAGSVDMVFSMGEAVHTVRLQVSPP